jgi:hypothetical protein
VVTVVLEDITEGVALVVVDIPEEVAVVWRQIQRW